MQVTTPKDAELNAAEKMQAWGFVDAASPLHSADGGIDVRSSRALAQVKFRSVKAGRPEIQNLVGARAGDASKALLFFDFKGYSPQAVQYANQMNVGLYTYDRAGIVTPVNQVARQIMAVSPGDKFMTTISSQQVRWTALVAMGAVLALGLIALSLQQL